MSLAIKNRKSSTPNELEDIRVEIDSVDAQIARLLEKRAHLVYSVGEYKRKHQLPVYDPTRESQIRKKARSLISKNGPLSASEMESFLMSLVERFRNLESIHTYRHMARSLFSDSHLDFRKEHAVVIWGFGLLGSSLYLALKEFAPHWKFHIVDPFLNVDLFLDWKIQNGHSNIDIVNTEQIKNKSLYILSGPCHINAHNLYEFDFPKSSIVFDVGSTKQDIMTSYINRNQKNEMPFYYVGGHPLAGKEVSGFENGDSMLFYNKTFCWVSPDYANIPNSVKTTFDIIALALGSKPVWTTADEHDKNLAWTSHLPQIISSTLASTLLNNHATYESEFYPGSARDFLRISGSSLAMWRPILQANKKNILNAISKFITNLNLTYKSIDNENNCDSLFRESNEFYNKLQKSITMRNSK